MKKTILIVAVMLVVLGIVAVRAQHPVDSSKEGNHMIVSAVQFTFAPEDADRAATLLREIRAASVKEPGVVRFEVGRSTDDPNVFVLWEVYRDKNAAEAHQKSEHFKRLVIEGIRPLARQRTAVTASPLLDAKQ